MVATEWVMMIVLKIIIAVEQFEQITEYLTIFDALKYMIMKMMMKKIKKR